MRKLFQLIARHPSEGWGLPILGRAMLREIPAFAGMTKMGAGIALLALPLAACTPNDPTMGAAVKHNYALQVIDPDPQYAGTPMEGASGDKAAAAVERYRTDKVKKPQGIRTTSGISGGGGGSN